MRKNAKKPQKPRRSSTGPQKALLQKNRSARETRQDRDHEGGGLGDHAGGLLQGAHRTPRRSTEAPERARSAAELAKHSHPFHARKTAQRRKKKQAHAWSTKFVVFSYIMSESEEWWFDVRPKAVGKNRPCPVEELCSESSKSSSALDETMARWYEAFETRVTASRQPIGLSCQAAQKQSLERKDPNVRVSTRRAKEEFTAPLVPNVEAWTVAVSPAAQEMLAMLRTMLLAASTSQSEFE